MYTQYLFSEQKQRKAKVKVKEPDPACSPIWLFRVQGPAVDGVGGYPGLIWAVVSGKAKAWSCSKHFLNLCALTLNPPPRRFHLS